MIRPVFITLVVTTASLGATLLVPEEYSTIQAALDAARPDDFVSVGPGVYPERVSVRCDRVTLQSRLPRGATIDGGGHGDVVSCIAVTATLEGFQITKAGGAGVLASDAAQVTIRGNVITGNAVAGIILETHATAWIEGNTITDNRYSSTSGWGIRCRAGASATIVNNYISGNGEGVGSNYGESVTIVSNTLRHNLYGLSLSGGRFVVQNNILAESQYGVFFRTYSAPGWEEVLTESLTMDHNDLWQNSVADYYIYMDPPCITDAGVDCNYVVESGLFTPSPGTGEMHADPLFDGDGACVQSGSPVVDAGENSAIPSGVTTDLSDQTRVLNGIVDIGACEFLGPDIGVLPQDGSGSPIGEEKPAGQVVSLFPLCGAGSGQAVLLSLVCISLVGLRPFKR